MAMLRLRRLGLAPQGNTALPLMICLLAGSSFNVFAADNTEITTARNNPTLSTNTVSEPPKVIASRPIPGKVLAFALIGTASYPGGAVAFFDGNIEEFKTSVHRGEIIGGWTVATIAFDHVRLTMGTNEFNLPMDKQLRRESFGDWQIRPLTGRFTPAKNPQSEQSLVTPEAGSDRRRSSTQVSDPGTNTRSSRTDRRSGDGNNRRRDPTGQ
ncbi:MAG: hypothetical protein H7X97_09110 [Opitutaceae bacterium]|nr:hypothetical protein [Verrucomicrobiales bacterium]